MTDYFIGIDIGTGSTKAIAVDAKGKTITTSRAAYPTLSPKPSYSEQNPEAILLAFKNCIKTITSLLKGAPKAISLSSAMHSIIPVDRNGQALSNMITWADNRSEEIADRLKASAEAPSLYEKGGTPIHAMSPLCKVIWFKENDAALFASTYKFISIKEYIWYHLLGEFEIDYSLASATGLFDVMTLNWNSTALKLAGISHDKLSKPVNTDTVRLCPREKTPDALGIPEGTPFVIGASDGCLANIGSLAVDHGTASLTIGTSGAIRVTSKTPVYNFSSMSFNYRLDEQTFVSGGPINNGGVALKWYAEQVLKVKLESPEDYKMLLSQLHKTGAGADGLVFLPYILGERAPIWDSRASGVFFGITAQHGQQHFTRAVLEGISMALYNVGKTLEDGGLTIEKINVSGGFVHNEQWLQILADIFGKHICLINAEDASALGAIYLAMKTLGVIKDYNHFKAEDVKVFYPDKASNTLYQKTMFPRYQRLYKSLKDEMALLDKEK